MKLAYQKPLLVKREVLSQITAVYVSGKVIV
jgi:hypothetical protein